MIPNHVRIDRTVSPAEISFATSFNLAWFFLDRHLEEGRKDKIAVRGRTWTRTFGELCTDACRMGNALKRLGVKPGDRVMLLAKDTPAFYPSFLGTIRIGAIVIPVNTFMRAADYGYMLADSKSKVVIVADGTIEEFEPALAQPGLAVEHRITTDSARPGWLHLNNMLAAESENCPIAETRANSPCFWLYSSGSTGAPKASVHEHKDMIYTSEYYAVETLGIRETDVIFSAPKLFFAYGLGNSFSFPLFIGCEAILLEDRPTADNTLSIIEQFKPTVYFGVPTLYAAQVALMDKGRQVAMPQLRLCLSGGEALPPAVMERWNRFTGLRILDGIGSSEGLHIYAQNLPDHTKAGSAGRAVTGYRMRIVDLEGNEVPENAPGELELHGESVAKYYWNKPEKTAASWTKDGWFRSGDTVYRDKEGYIFFCGRGDDMLKVGGIWVSPFEIESALASHPEISEAAVIGAPDADGLIKPKAYCVLRQSDKAGPDMERDLIQFARNRLAPFKYPRWVVFVNELPKTDSGKIQRFRLRASC
jgi:benzoate-CoA ligase family protein